MGGAAADCGFHVRHSGGACGETRSGAPALIEVVFRNGLRLGGIEFGGWVEVVGEGFLGGLFSFPTAEIHVELSLGWPPDGMDQRG